jgi:hypothetical protein
MPHNTISSAAATTLPVIGIVLGVANWNARPDAAVAWAAAIVMFLVMIGVRRRWRIAVHRSGEAALIQSFASVTASVVFGALMMVVPLMVTLAHAYGVVDDPDGGRRASMIILGAYLVVTGNALPRMLPPPSSMPGDGARVQAFHRLAGWTWVVCGLGYVIAWLALPIGVAEPVSMAFVLAAMIVTIVQRLRLRKPRQHAQA